MLNFSCEKQEMDIMIVEGYIKDDATKLPVAGITIHIDAIKSPSGMGIITDGKRKKAGETVTDANGHYKVKLRVFEEAEMLEFWLNRGGTKKAFEDAQRVAYLSDLNKDGHNRIDFDLTPLALLKINFRNVDPISNADFFYFGWYTTNSGGSWGSVNEENCGSVIPSEARIWTGMDVCGSTTVRTAAEKSTSVYWTVKKNNITKEYNESVFVKRGVLNEFTISY